MQERHELQLRQRDIAERNVATEIRQLGASIRFFSLVFLHMIEQSAVNQELGQGVSGRRDKGGVGQGGKAGGHHVLHCISVFINWCIPAGCRSLPVYWQGCFLLRAVRGGSAGGKGGDCH